MGGLVMLERFVWFDRELKSGRYPNASRLARKFKYILATDTHRHTQTMKSFYIKENFLKRGSLCVRGAVLQLIQICFICKREIADFQIAC